MAEFDSHPGQILLSQTAARWIVLLLLVAVLVSLITTAAGAVTKSLVRITCRTSEEMALLPRGLDVAGRSMDGWIEVVATPGDVNRIQATGVPMEIIHQDVEAYSASVKGSYHSFEGLVTDLEIYTTVFSSISRMDTVGWTYEGRPLLVIKISDHVSVDEPEEPELFFMGLHHAREWPSLEIAFFIIDSLLTTYGFEPHITELVDSREIWVMPCVNPDGYVYCHDEGNDWRKNRRFFPQFSSYGVDLNRNYNGACNGSSRGSWGTTTTYGTSHYPWDSAYCGPFPFSELEIQAIRDLYLAHDFVFSVSYHTYWEAVLWPWGYSAEEVVPYNDLIADVGAQMASRIARQSGGGSYLGTQSPGIGYNTTGDTNDWAYGYYHYVLGSNCLPYTVEACDQFHPPEISLDQVVRENFDGAIYLCEIADSIADLLQPRVMPPVIDPLGTVAGGNFTISWSPQNPQAVADLYQLDELTGFSALTDDSEESSSWWDLAGFQRSTMRSHSGSYSYHSSSEVSNAYDAMTTTRPYLVSPGDSLTFWCWHDIEEAWDMAYAEVSTDGRCFRLPDSTATFNGTSGGWVRRAYSLEDCAGQSVYFRLRYTTDGENEWEGFYVDDLYPVADCAVTTTLSASIADTFYAISGQPPGDYLYRVRGHNDAWGWGDWSCCRLATVAGPTPPATVVDLRADLSGGVLLSWSPVTLDTAGAPVDIDHYVIYRDTVFDFVASPANSLAAASQAHYLDGTAAVGEVSTDHYYIIQAVDDAGTKSQDSETVGEFDRHIQRWK